MMMQPPSVRKQSSEKRPNEKKQEYDYLILRRCVLSEDSISVDCTFYVWTVLIFSALMVLGGMAIPFAVRDCIKGFDPFQITTFIWHDFASHSVMCRSVKDLGYVTSIKPQIIIAWLLQEEQRNILVTRGPYNGMFLHRGDNSGFPIDEPTSLSLMLHSGFVVLKVANEKGGHLVCLDVCRGAQTAFCIQGRWDTYLACLDVGKDDTQMEADDIEKEHSKIKGHDVFPGPAHGGEEKAEPAQETAQVLKQDKKKAVPVLFLKEAEVHLTKIVGNFILDSRFG
ncbi:hypothetical protein BCR34DRAFT_607917 [Clohesyomyces aquaticus]|uniref:Uncharacterized protein n=1 Tax=Clohesyomyces aquaticus TaxID=1231657 RepID=A0A1Y1YC31_9PLEO|nr:hypothetical protein BCR34DRAFT_607917 [Clohesyomyces aquaticus]